jgi:hypothetical protein
MQNSTNAEAEEESPTNSTTPPSEKPNLKLKEALKRSTQRTLQAMTVAARERKTTTRQRAPFR